MSDLDDLPLAQVLRFAEAGRAQAQASVQAQMNYQRYFGLFQNSLGFLQNPLSNYQNWPQTRYVRRTTDADLDRRYKQLTIDLKARRA